MATVDWTDSEKVLMSDLVAIATSYSRMQEDLRVLVAEMDDLGTQPWRAMLQDIINKYTEVHDE